MERRLYPGANGHAAGMTSRELAAAVLAGSKAMLWFPTRVRVDRRALSGGATNRHELTLRDIKSK
jgi:hypothetical protein